LLETLGRELPEFGVGPVTFSQTVHWQPNFGAAKSEEKAAATYKRTRHENHFAATGTPILFRWEGVTLAENQRSLLETIMPYISYFGRAESLCALSLTGEHPWDKIGWCKPCLDKKTNRPIRRISEKCRDLFCPDPVSFQAADLWCRRAERNQLDGSQAPPHLVDDLLAHQPLPDGARWVSYQMPEGWPERWIVRVAKPTRHRKPMNTAPRIARHLQFSLQCRVPVPLKFTVPLAEQFRDAAVSHFFKANGKEATSFALTGHNKPPDAQGEHQHAFYLPLGTDHSHPALLNELHIWCPYGFTQPEIEAVMRVQCLYWGGGNYPIRPILLAINQVVSEDCPISVGQVSSSIWRSRTPFVPPRYFYRGNLHGAKLKTADEPEQQLAKCLQQTGINIKGEILRIGINGKPQRSLPPGSDWDVVRAPVGEESLADAVVTDTHVPTHARMEKVRRIGLFFEVAFDGPVALPVPALGHSCHFGLGMFMPVKDLK
jgi:CRISPR-associated protein Csb2